VVLHHGDDRTDCVREGVERELKRRAAALTRRA